MKRRKPSLRLGERRPEVSPAIRASGRNAGGRGLGREKTVWTESVRPKQTAEWDGFGFRGHEDNIVVVHAGSGSICVSSARNPCKRQAAVASAQASSGARMTVRCSWDITREESCRKGLAGLRASGPSAFRNRAANADPTPGMKSASVPGGGNSTLPGRTAACLAQGLGKKPDAKLDGAGIFAVPEWRADAAQDLRKLVARQKRFEAITDRQAGAARHGIDRPAAPRVH